MLVFPVMTDRKRRMRALQISVSCCRNMPIETAIPIADGEAISYVDGDVNGDGVYNISDVVTLQKWIQKYSDAKLANWKAADLFEDCKVDIFDLGIMKRELITK